MVDPDDTKTMDLVAACRLPLTAADRQRRRREKKKRERAEGLRIELAGTDLQQVQQQAARIAELEAELAAARAALQAQPAEAVRRPAMRYHGGKFRIAPWVQQFFPAHSCYVEAFGGAAGVLLRKPRSYAEVYNDLDGEVVTFFRVLRDPSRRAELIEALERTPYAREEFEQAFMPAADPVEVARRLAVRAQMGFGSAGATKGKTGFRIDTQREHGTAAHLWSNYPATLQDVGQRFAGVLIENRPALDVMRAHDAPTTLHYVDPPYLHATRHRASSERRYYRHEMNDAEHEALLAGLQGLEGFVVLSGYDSDLYRDALQGWESRQTTARISAGRGTGLRTEVVWLSPSCSAALREQGALADLFHHSAEVAAGLET